MQACVNDGKEIVALGFMRFAILPLHWVEKISLNEVSNLVGLNQNVFHLTVNLVTLQPQILSCGAFCRKDFPSIGQLVLMDLCPPVLTVSKPQLVLGRLLFS